MEYLRWTIHFQPKLLSFVWLVIVGNIDFAQIEEQDLTREEVKSMLVKALEREREVIFDNGKKEGIDIGKKEGIDIGKQEGIDERNHQIAQAMLSNGFALPTIATLLALSLLEVERLLAEDDANENVVA